MKIYRAGLVGCGRIGTLWETDPPTPVTHAGALAVVPQIELVAGASRGLEHLHAFGKRWGVTALYQDYHEMFAREKLDIVCIATHPGLHRPIVEAAVAAGVKGILCEKPLALSLTDADALVAACRAHSCVLAVNHSRRWDPAHRQAKQMVERGLIGDLVAIYGFCQGVKPFPAWTADEEGPLIHDAVHLFDLFRLFAGDPLAVVGTAVRRWQPFRVEDDSHAIFTFANGLRAVAMVNELTRYNRFGLEIQGTEGVIKLADDGNHWWRSVDRTDRINEPNPQIEWWQLEPEPFPAVPAGSSILAAVQELVDCMEAAPTGGPTPSSTGEDGIASLEMVMAIYESQRRGNQPVTFPLAERASVLYQLRAEGHF